MDLSEDFWTDGIIAKIWLFRLVDYLVYAIRYIASSSS